MADPIEKVDEVEETLEVVEGSPEGEGFEDMLDLADDVSGDEVSEGEGEAEPAQEGEGEEPSEDPAPAEVTPEPEPTPEPEVPDDPKEEETPPEEVPEQPSLEEAQAKWQAELQDSYKLSEEEADQFVTSPETVVPKLAAMLHSRITTELLQTVAQSLPQYIQQAVGGNPAIVSGALEQVNAQKEAETQFLTAFPDLKDHQAKVVEVLKVVKAAPENAQATREELIIKAGNATRAMLGLTAPSATPAEPTPAPVKPFSPAQTGGASAPAAAPTQSEWDDIIETELI